MRRVQYATVLTVIALLLALASEYRDGRPAAGPANGKVVRVVDGDTIVVQIGRERQTTRALLIDTPETVKPGTKVQCYGPEASAATKRLVRNRTVSLTFDRELRDRYGRTLAYVDVDGRDLGAELVKGGFARVKVYPPNKARAAAYKRLERQARRQRVGLWGRCAN